MSTLSALPKPLKLVLKPGTYQSGDTRGGLNINNWMKNFLKRIGFADTVDCCVYYPTAPTVIVENENNPTEAEMDAAGIPIKGFFFAQDANGNWAYTVRTSASGSVGIATNN